MPGLVPGIQPTASSGTDLALDSGNKCRNDMDRRAEAAARCSRDAGAATRAARIGSTISRISLIPIAFFTSLPSMKKFGVPMMPSVRPRSLIPLIAAIMARFSRQLSNCARVIPTCWATLKIGSGRTSWLTQEACCNMNFS